MEEAHALTAASDSADEQGEEGVEWDTQHWTAEEVEASARTLLAVRAQQPQPHVCRPHPPCASLLQECDDADIPAVLAHGTRMLSHLMQQHAPAMACVDQHVSQLLADSLRVDSTCAPHAYIAQCGGKLWLTLYLHDGDSERLTPEQERLCRNRLAVLAELAPLVASRLSRLSAGLKIVRRVAHKLMLAARIVQVRAVAREGELPSTSRVANARSACFDTTATRPASRGTTLHRSATVKRCAGQAPLGRVRAGLLPTHSRAGRPCSSCACARCQSSGAPPWARHCEATSPPQRCWRSYGAATALPVHSSRR